MKIIFNIYKVPVIIEQNKNSQHAKNFHRDYLECPIFGAEMKKINIYNILKQAKISKIARIFSKRLRKKMSWIFPSIGFFNSQIFDQKWKKFNLFNLPQIYQAKYRFWN
jgi:hypothetical protein